MPHTDTNNSFARIHVDLIDMADRVSLAERDLAAARRDQAKMIRMAIRRGMSYRGIAESSGLSHQRIAQIFAAGSAWPETPHPAGPIAE